MSEPPMSRFVRVLAVLLLVIEGGCESEPQTSAKPEPELETGVEPSSVAARPEATALVPDPPATGGGSSGELAVEPDEPTEPVPPADYGVLKFPRAAPSADELTHHALAGYEVVAVYELPDMEAKKVGFLRLGQRMRVTAKVEGASCRKGWHGLPQGGFACASKGLVVDAERPPYMKQSPPPPRLDETYPYDWAFVRKWNTPMWWRIPRPDEFAEMQRQREHRELTRTLEERGANPVSATELLALRAGSLPLPSVSSPVASPEASPPASAGGSELGSETVSADGAATDAAEVEPMKLPLSPDHPWLERGYFVAVVGVEKDGPRAYWRTARGAYVPKAHTFKYEAKDFAGRELDETRTLPVGYVIKKTAALFELDEAGKLRKRGQLERREFVDLTEAVEVNGKNYMATTDGQLVDAARLAMPQVRPLPKGLEPWERWIDVDLSSQVLVAYEGDRPVYVTLVSTGKKGTEEEPFETPVGRWRIYSKQVTSNMDGTTATDGNYAIQDVPWVMYFDGSYALHGAFWHRSFGYVRSHGCVNLGPSDARWLFQWTYPSLPDGWHGVHATDSAPGTTVVVHE
ncbi:MAG: L,D-transpeptidase [Myxococcales bacterium FL481]|nr:MAG: L,D-transpeptidase [Myxococcales bacterium FL481]